MEPLGDMGQSPSPLWASVSPWDLKGLKDVTFQGPCSGNTGQPLPRMSGWSSQHSPLTPGTCPRLQLHRLQEAPRGLGTHPSLVPDTQAAHLHM